MGINNDSGLPSLIHILNTSCSFSPLIRLKMPIRGLGPMCTKFWNIKKIDFLCADYGTVFREKCQGKRSFMSVVLKKKIYFFHNSY